MIEKVKKIPDLFKTLDRKWLIAWGIIYGLFLILGLFIPNSFIVNAIKIIGILSCLLYVIFNSEDKLLIVAMFFTLCADVVLAINNVAPIGVVVFCCVQFAHLIRLTKKDIRIILAISFIMAFFVIFTLISHQIPSIVAIGMVYAVALVANLILSRNWYKKNKKSLPAKRAFLGFALFIACDICVAISFISLNQVLPDFLYAPANYLAWLFYLPSQILIANSSKTMIK